MLRLKQAIFVTSFIVCWTVLICPVHSQEPGWTTKVIKRGQDRQVSKNTQILNRPYRPFHFYGNTIRRLHYHGKILPSRQDSQKTNRNRGRRSSIINNENRR